LIDAGLKAQLKSQSLVTGMLYVEFNFHRDQAVKLRKLNYKNLTELPSVESTEDQIKNTADELMTKLRKLPLEAIVNDLAASLKAIREMTTSEDLKQNKLALQKTLAETQKLMADMQHAVGPMLNNMNLTIIDMRSMVQQFARGTQPVLLSTEKTLNTANQILLESNYALNSLETLTSPDAPLWQSLEAFRDAAQSTKDLTDYLEQHPDAIIYGKE
jgi:paraquat-inducible protein B